MDAGLLYLNYSELLSTPRCNAYRGLHATQLSTMLVSELDSTRLEKLLGFTAKQNVIICDCVADPKKRFETRRDYYETLFASFEELVRPKLVASLNLRVKRMLSKYLNGNVNLENLGLSEENWDSRIRSVMRLDETKFVEFRLKGMKTFHFYSDIPIPKPF